MLKETSLSVARREPQEHLVVRASRKAELKLTVNKVLMVNVLTPQLDKP